MNNTKVRRFDGDCMELGDGLGKYVLYSDYAALEAERDARDQESIERGQRIASLKEALERCSQERNRQALEAEVQKLREACANLQPLYKDLAGLPPSAFEQISDKAKDALLAALAQSKAGEKEGK